MKPASRRQVVASACAAAALSLPVPGWAAWQKETPRQPAGPFYTPLKPLSVDNDLVFAPGRDQPSDGDILHLSGRIADPLGRPIAGARVEIWQANAYGRYNHPRHAIPSLKLDENFQGFGHDLTDGEGRYRFRTVKPAPYGEGGRWMRTPHIHFAVFPPDDGHWTTQLYFEGEPLNERDFLLQGIADPAERARVIARILQLDRELGRPSGAATFDIVLGRAGTRRERT